MTERHPKIIVGSRKLWEAMGKIISEADMDEATLAAITAYDNYTRLPEDVMGYGPMRAALTAAAESHKPVAWMIREPDGSLHWSEMCLFDDEGSARDYAEELTDGRESNVFTVVPLYTHPAQADLKKKQEENQ